ncbi:MAG: porin [Pseudomonadota bacterium]
MHQRLLLGTTALAGAGMLFTSTAMAQDGGLEVVLSGFTEFGVAAASGDTLDNSTKNQNYNFFTDSEIQIRVNGLTDGGVRYGAKIEVGFDNPSSATIDEVGLFFSGNFGRVELGRDDGAEDLIFVGAEDAQAGTGGIDGDTANLNNVQFADTGDAVKATYFTPRIAGFQAGFSWTPDGDDNQNGNGNTAFNAGDDNRKNSAGGGINWVGVLGPVDLTVSAVGLYADVKGGGGTQTANGFRDDQKAYAFGALLGFGGLSFGASFNDFKGPQEGGGSSADEGKILSFGLAYGFGPANVSVGFDRNWNDDADNSNVFNQYLL